MGPELGILQGKNQHSKSCFKTQIYKQNSFKSRWVTCQCYRSLTKYQNDAYSVLKCCQRTEKCQAKTNIIKVEVSMKTTKSGSTLLRQIVHTNI